MNVQEINHSGPNLWAFFTTAILALMITGGSWLGVSLLATNGGVEWYKGRSNWRQAQKEAEAAHDLAEQRRGWLPVFYQRRYRLAMLFWLLRHGHTY